MSTYIWGEIKRIKFFSIINNKRVQTLKNTAVMYSRCLNHMGLAGLSGHLQAALPTAAGWHFKQAALLRRSRKALGTDLLHSLPGENNADTS